MREREALLRFQFLSSLSYKHTNKELIMDLFTALQALGVIVLLITLYSYFASTH